MPVTPTSCITIELALRVVGEETPLFPAQEVTVILGCGFLPRALEEALVGMNLHEQRVIRLSPAQAFGEFDPQLLVELPREEFGPGGELFPGAVFAATDDEGEPVRFVIRSVGSATVLADFNHPLAGKEVEFQVTLKEVREPTLEEAESLGCTEILAPRMSGS